MSAPYYVPKTKPYTHQQEAYDKLKDAQYFALLEDMGLGKSKTAIDIIGYKNLLFGLNRVVVITLNAVHPQWVDEQFPAHYPLPWVGFSYFAKNKKKSYIRDLDLFMMRAKTEPSTMVFTINIESFARDAGSELVHRFCNGNPEKLMIIVDEASRIKNPGTKTVRNLFKLRRQLSSCCRCIITGTPAAKRPADLWSLYEFLNKGYMKCTYTAFQKEHTVMVKKTFERKGRLVSRLDVIDPVYHKKVQTAIKNACENGQIDTYRAAAIRDQYGLSAEDFHLIASSDELIAHKNLRRLQEKIAPVTFSASKEDCLDLPEKIYETITLPLNPEQKRLIKDLKKYSMTTFDEHELTIEVRALLSMRVLQICGGFVAHHTDIEGKFEPTKIKGTNYKLQHLVESVPEVGNQQFIVWAVFRPEIELLYEELSKVTTCKALYGVNSTDPESDNDKVKQFKAGEFQCLVSNPTVGGYGLNLQGALLQYWYSRNYRTEARLQAEDRSHRIGTASNPVYKDLLCDIPTERRVLDVLRQGKDLNSCFVDVSINDIFKV